MSIARQLLHEFRPLFHMLDEPFSRGPSHFTSTGFRNCNRDRLFRDPFGGVNMFARPAVDITKKGNKYIVDVDLPGVSRENLQVRLGDGNQSITIEGKVTERSSSGVHDVGVDATPSSDPITASAECTDASHSTSAAKDGNDVTQISVERSYNQNYSFTRTVWLPHPADPSSVIAKLQNGVLSISLDKGTDEQSRVITVEEA